MSKDKLKELYKLFGEPSKDSQSMKSIKNILHDMGTERRQA